MTQEFRSRIEDLVETEELKIRQEVAFGKYAGLMPAESKSHPAKYNPELVEILLEKYTQPGDTVLDPMAGTGLLSVIAALRGRNAIQVELEPRYFDWMEKARENVEKLHTLTEKGKILNILGDSRRMTELLAERVLKHYGQADTVIVSPPYGDAVSDDKEGPLAGADIRRYGRWREGTARRHSYTQHLTPVKPDMNVDAVITSPPYERILSHERHHTPNTGSAEKLLVEKQLGWYPAGSKDNIGNLSLGPVDAVITSPPYSDAKPFDDTEFMKRIAGDQAERLKKGEAKGHTFSVDARRREFERAESGKPSNPDNIGNLPLGDTDKLEKQDSLQQIYKKLLTKKGRPTYLSEMLLVYKNMFEVLRPGGVACVVVKPFVKDRRVVDLPYITWCLLRDIGFILEKAYKWRIERPSFWRVLYSKRFPEVPQVSHEYVVVVRKPGGGEM
jgi:DNA modification methylase